MKTLVSTTLAISPLVLLACLAWMPVSQPAQPMTRLERERAVYRLWEKVRPDYSVQEVREFNFPLGYPSDPDSMTSNYNPLTQE